jgi:hypothetical protein
MTQAQAVQLCTGATSSNPVACFARIRETSGLETTQLLGYCAALQWPYAPPPNPGAPVCVDAARADGLADAQAVQLCRGSTSTGPAECVARGHDLAGLADGDLVELCTIVVPWPTSPYGGGPTTY